MSDGRFRRLQGRLSWRGCPRLFRGRPPGLSVRLALVGRAGGQWFAVVAVLGLAVAGLAGCGPKPNTFAPYCPAPKRLPDASEISVFRPGATGQDITDLVVRGEILNLSGSCRDGDTENTVQADAAVTFRFVRGPAMVGRDYVVPYLLTVSLGDTIRDQGAYRIHVTFPANIDTVTLASAPVHMVFPLTKTTTAASYSIWAAFGLTPEQLERNRQNGVR